MTRRSVFLPSAVFLSLCLSACGGSDDPNVGDGTADQAEEAASSVAVRIVQPTEGATVAGPDLRVTLEIDGMEIRPAGDPTPNTGHHHLYLDHDLTDPTQPIPAIPGQVIHMGDGSSEFVFEGVTSGEHRLIAVVGDLVHVPLQPWIVDTVVFVVR